MASFDIFDDEEEFGPQPLEAPKQPTLAEQFAAKSAEVDKGIAEDRAKFESNRKRGNIGKLLSGMNLYAYDDVILGDQKKDTSFADSMLKQNQDDLDANVAARKKALEDLMMKDQLEYQDVERDRATKDFGMKEESHGLNTEKARFGLDEEKTLSTRQKDPNSALANTARKFFSNQYGIAPESLQDFNYQEMKELGQHLTKADKGGSNYQQSSIEIPGKGVYRATFDPGTGRYEISPHLAGYKTNYDSVTGTRSSGADYQSPAIDVLTQDGDTVRDSRTALEGERGKIEELGKAEGRKGVEVAEADAAVSRKQGLVDKWSGRYKAAQKEPQLFGLVEGGVGPAKGRLTGVKNTVGISSGANTDSLRNELLQDMNAYIKEISGATVPVQEVPRLMAVLPKATDDEELFQKNLEMSMRQAERIANKLKMEREGIKAQRLGQEPKSATTKTPPQPTTVKVSDGNQTLEIPIEDLQDAEADGFKRID